MRRLLTAPAGSRRALWVIAGLALAGHGALLLALGGSVAPAPAAAQRVLRVALYGAAPAPRPDAEFAEAPAARPVAAPAPKKAAAVEPVPASLLSLAGLRPAHYFLPQELNEKPQLLHDVAPDLAFLQLPAGPTLSAVLRLLISEAGDIDLVEVDRSQLPEAVAQAVISAYANLKFTPGKIAGLAVKSQLKIEVRLENSTTL